MKAQVAFEYIIIVGVVITFLIPLWSYIAVVNEQATQSLSISQAQTAANRIVSASDLVYTQGPPAQLTITIFIPRGVESANLTDTTVRFRVYIGKGVTDVAAVALGPLNGSIPRREGLYRFSIKAVEDYVNISY